MTMYWLIGYVGKIVSSSWQRVKGMGEDMEVLRFVPTVIWAQKSRKA